MIGVTANQWTGEKSNLRSIQLPDQSLLALSKAWRGEQRAAVSRSTLRSQQDSTPLRLSSRSDERCLLRHGSRETDNER